MNEFEELKLSASSTLGYKCYEDVKSHQNCWYGTSDKFDDFKEMASNKVETGTICFTMDDCKKYMYSAYKDTWYELT